MMMRLSIWVVKMMKRMKQMIYRLKRRRKLSVYNLHRLTRVFGKNYGRGEIDSEEIYSLSREPKYYISNFYVKELQIMLGE